MKNGEYESVEQMDTDLSLMFENAKRYNMPNSSIYKRAFRLQQILQVMIPACARTCLHSTVRPNRVIVLFNPLVQ